MDPAKPQNAAEAMMWGNTSTAPEFDGPPIGASIAKRAPKPTSAAASFLGLMAFSVLCVGLAFFTQAQDAWNPLYYFWLSLALSLAIRSVPYFFAILIGRGRD